MENREIWNKNNFDCDSFIKGKIAVYCDTLEKTLDFKDFMNILEIDKKHFPLTDEDIIKMVYRYNESKCFICKKDEEFHFNNKICRSPIDYAINNNYKVVDWEIVKGKWEIYRDNQTSNNKDNKELLELKQEVNSLKDIVKGLANSFVNTDNVIVPTEVSSEKEVKTISATNNKIWTPKLNEVYYCFYSDGVIDSFTWDNDERDKGRLSMGNVFKTEEEAKRKVFELQLIHKLKMFVLENSEVTLDEYYDLCYFHSGYSICYLGGSITYCQYTTNQRDFNSIVFPTREVTKRAIEIFKDELIRYFTTNE